MMSSTIAPSTLPSAAAPAAAAVPSRSRRRRSRLLLGLVAGLAGLLAATAAPAAAQDGAEGTPALLSDSEAPGGVHWLEWSPAVFATAKAQHRLVLLDVGAGWCHWCHVMDQVTYHDPAVLSQLGEHYLAIHVDQDLRPDIANRYEDYGWPATVIFDASGQELVKRRGYLPPAQMASILQAVVADPTPGPSIVAAPQTHYAATAGLSPALRSQLQEIFTDGYDPVQAGWGHDYKFLEPTSIEYAWLRADRGDATGLRMATDTLAAERALIDPVWGGACQYSVGGHWSEPHYEKIMQVQTDVLRIYSLAWSRSHDARDLAIVHDIERFTATFLTSPQGAFYAAQDADVTQGQESTPYYALDDQARRARGIPRVDQHLYTRENGWMIEALAQAYASTGEPEILARALRATQWVLVHRTLPGGTGGFSHDRHDLAGPYLGDNLAMGRAFLMLYLVTGDATWLSDAEAQRVMIDAAFANPPGGYRTAVSGDGMPVGMERDENISLTRWAVALGAITNQAADRAMAEHAARYICDPATASERPTSGVLLADEALSHAPLHIVVVGPRNDPQAQGLFRDAIAYGVSYKQVEWWDPSAGPLPGGVPAYPPTPVAAYVCNDGACFPPVHHDLAQALPRLLHHAAVAAP